MKLVRPKNLGAATSKLPLTPEEGFVLSRIDGKISVNDLVQLTGLAPERVEQIVTKLETHGAVAVESAEPPPARPSTKMQATRAVPLPRAEEFGPGTTSLEDFAAALGLSGETPAPAPAAEPPKAPNPPAPVEAKPETTSLEEFAAALGLRFDASAPPKAEAAPEPEGAPRPEPVDSTSKAPPRSAELEEVREEAIPEADAAPTEETPAAEEDEPPKEEILAAEASAVERERNYRQLYETKWHTMPVDARVGGAKKASGADLFALCLDPDPRVISAVIENPQVGLDHVRMIAFHHRTTTGIEILARRAEWLRDLLVERRLLRNPQVGDIVLGKIMAQKRIGQTYRICIDREVPELTRVKSRGHLRKKWQTAQPEDRAELVIRTEARCLTLLTGCTFDARTTQILCGRPYNSVLFIQNLAKFAATPPALLAHLFKQPFVRKIAPLKKLLLQHPNMPGEVKRQV